MSLQDFPDWLTELEAEDFEFLRLFVLTSGSTRKWPNTIRFPTRPFACVWTA